MKAVILGLGTVSIGFGIFMLLKGHPFVDQLALFVNGIVLIGMAYIDDTTLKCQSKNRKL
jgi:hypothetical protein